MCPPTSGTKRRKGKRGKRIHLPIHSTVKALTGIHLKQSFRSRVWKHVKTLKLSKMLFQFLFLKTLQRKKIYPLLDDDNLVLQFLF
jgi:hypothetical protein